jgi:hypothetical protein
MYKVRSVEEIDAPIKQERVGDRGKIDRRNKILCADPTDVPLIVAGNGLSDLRNSNSNYSACIIGRR